MGSGLFIAVTVACFVLGLPCRGLKLVAVAVGLWVLGLGIAALAGAFQPTGEDNFLAMFFFTGLPTMLWLAAFCGGLATGELLRARRGGLSSSR